MKMIEFTGRDNLKYMIDVENIEAIIEITDDMGIIVYLTSGNKIALDISFEAFKKMFVYRR